ncbi:UNKNOWN [Stylonychia lemnae]|uniref:Uncharacterized protein n=1 Tax=Stylonychia lemnae TaxID=5949 RepID=A0A078ADG2_STYLE|nr:UNKNOWN [Stylonychia lemnae]|eukprot:CDW78888.1 UNKNOWN [Stylonychia lemnae]
MFHQSIATSIRERVQLEHSTQDLVSRLSSVLGSIVNPNGNNGVLGMRVAQSDISVQSLNSYETFLAYAKINKAINEFCDVLDCETLERDSFKDLVKILYYEQAEKGLAAKYLASLADLKDYSDKVVLPQLANTPVTQIPSVKKQLRSVIGQAVLDLETESK